MTRYRVVAPMGVTFPAGSVLDLSDEQAKRRHGQVERQKDGLFKVLSPVGFKAGEMVGFAGEVPKTLERVMEDPRTGETVATGKAKAAAKAEKDKPAKAAGKSGDAGAKGGEKK